MKSSISLLSSSKRFSKIDEFSSETSRFAMIICRSSQTTRVQLTRGTHERRPLSAFWPISEHLTTELWYNHQEYFYTRLLIGSLFLLCLHQTLLNRAFLVDNCVNSSHLEIVTFVLVCDTWGSARVTESKPSMKMGHFGVISQCRIDQYVDYLQNLKHLWVKYNQKGARIWCKNDWTTT